MTTAQLIHELARRLNADQGRWRIDLTVDNGTLRHIELSRTLNNRELERNLTAVPDLTPSDR